MLTFETFSAVRAAGVEDAGECLRCQQICRLCLRKGRREFNHKGHTDHKEEGRRNTGVVDARSRRMALIIAQGKGKPLKRLHLPCDQ